MLDQGCIWRESSSVDTFKKAKSGRGSLSLVSVQKYLEREVYCVHSMDWDKRITPKASLSFLQVGLAWLKGSIGYANDFT